MILKTTLRIQENVPLAPLTTFKIGGPARFFAKAETEELVVEALELAVAKGLDVFVLGGGSNIVVSDDGFDGLVVHVALLGVEQNGDTMIAAAGEDWDELVAYCVGGNLAGVECLSGIPGSVGGTPVQNVGAYGQDVSETIVSVRCLDRRSRQVVDLDNSACGFSYRKSIFNSTERDRYVVLSVTYRLAEGGRPKIVYKDLREHFGDREPTLAETRETVLRIRRAKSMVIDENDPNSRSAGSFFKNPIVYKAMLPAVAATLGASRVPNFPVDEQRTKIPAAWLIEQSGLYKGTRLGNAGISSNHSLAIVNLGGAKATEIMSLMNLIQGRVREKFGIELVPEPIFIGKI